MVKKLSAGVKRFALGDWVSDGDDDTVPVKIVAVLDGAEGPLYATYNIASGELAWWSEHQVPNTVKKIELDEHALDDVSAGDTLKVNGEYVTVLARVGEVVCISRITNFDANKKLDVMGQIMGLISDEEEADALKEAINDGKKEISSSMSRRTYGNWVLVSRLIPSGFRPVKE